MTISPEDVRFLADLRIELDELFRTKSYDEQQAALRLTIHPLWFWNVEIPWYWFVE